MTTSYRGPSTRSLRRQAWVVPEQIGGYPLPHGGQFGPSKPSLDPAVFDRDERMHP
jgi:hypothetical protein